ncbi:MAG: hypothetical protein IH881_12015 [Myxococcales bacterium]|nr:hypothetical protein [Myxococcales bacterium]
MSELLLAWPRLPVGIALAVALAAGLIARFAGSSPSLANGHEKISAAATAKPPWPDIASPHWHFATGALLVITWLVVTTSYDDYGYNIDEIFQAPLGVEIADWYLRGLSPQGSFDEFVPRVDAMAYYGGFFELPAEMAARVSPLDRTSTRHLVTAWLGVVGLGAVAWLGCLLHSRAAGFLSALLLALTPRFYGHFFANPKDLPFAVFSTFMLLAICGALSSLPRLSMGRILALGVAIGACMGIRVAGVINFAFLGLGMTWWLGKALVDKESEATSNLKRELMIVIGCAIAVAVVAWGVMLVGWPWAQFSPLLRPLQALGFFGDIAQELNVDFSVLFDGSTHLLSRVPARYSVQWLAISAPEFWLLAPVTIWALVQWARRRSPGWPKPREMAWVVVAVSVVAPLAATVLLGVIQFDGIRHFLFLLPPLTVMLAASLVEFLAGRHGLSLRVATLAALVALALLTLLDMRALHPYQYVYFNRSVAGGLPGAAERYETDYLGLSYREGMRQLFALRGGDEGASSGQKISVSACQGMHATMVDALDHIPGSEADFVASRPIWRPDIVLAFTRTNCHRRHAGRVLGTVERMGVPLLYLMEQSKTRTPRR